MLAELSWLAALVGVALLVWSLFFTAIHGVQIAVIGLALITLGILLQLKSNRGVAR